MLVKEYRICMPLSVEEYHIGQLYMIAKHSAEESHGGEGVEVIENRPHEDQEHGKGQFTEKRIHLSSRLPGWIKSFVPRVFYITEKAWNYYPYTITEYTCSFVPRFSISIQTKYENNPGTTDNCLNLSGEILESLEVDHVDILSDEVSPHHYKASEDLSTFHSDKTGRGPLKDGWKHHAEVVMCSYKAVEVRLDVWGIQARVEDFVHRSIREILLLGHRQAFAWVDDWYGMDLDGVRDFEQKMQQETNERMRENSGFQRSVSVVDDVSTEAATEAAAEAGDGATTPTTPTPKKAGWFSW